LTRWPFPDGHGGEDVEKFVEDLRRGLRRAHGETLAHEVATRGVECASCAGLAHGSKCSNRERYSEDAEIVVVDLVPEPGVADLVEPLELVEGDGISVGHEDAVERDGQTCLAKRFHLLRFTEQLRSCGIKRCWRSLE